MFIFGKKHFKKQGAPKALFRDQLQYFYDAFFIS